MHEKLKPNYYSLEGMRSEGAKQAGQVKPIVNEQEETRHEIELNAINWPIELNWNGQVTQQDNVRVCATGQEKESKSAIWVHWQARPNACDRLIVNEPSKVFLRGDDTD